jgi:hypothetical protein
MRVDTTKTHATSWKELEQVVMAASNEQWENVSSKGVERGIVEAVMGKKAPIRRRQCSDES